MAKPKCECPKHAERVNPRTGQITCKNCGKSKGYDLTVLVGKGK